MQKYRLKEEAKPYFRVEIENLELPLDGWLDKNVSTSALEKVPDTKPIVSVVDSCEYETNLCRKSMYNHRSKLAKFYFTVGIEKCSLELYRHFCENEKTKTAFTRAIEDAAKNFIDEIQMQRLQP